MIYLGADHGGVAIKEKIKEWLTEWKIQFSDLGASTIQADDDYPDYAFLVAQAVSLSPNEHKGILLCRSGGGMVIAANRIKTIRAVYISDSKSALHARTHNDANIASFSSEWTDEQVIKESLHIFLLTPFSQEERHSRRIHKLDSV